MMPIWFEQDRPLIADWLKRLPKPIALFAVTDVHAKPILGICLAEGIAVPEDIAVVGAENDEWFCRLCQPPLSSVEENGRRIGLIAAQLLHDAWISPNVVELRRLQYHRCSSPNGNRPQSSPLKTETPLRSSDSFGKGLVMG